MNPDEFIVDDDADVNGVNGSQPAADHTNRNFLVLASLLTGTLLLLSLGTLGFLLTGQTSERTRQVAAIETQNAVILATNAAVTQTVEVMAMERLATAEAAGVADASMPSPAGGEDAGAELLGGMPPEDATATAVALATSAVDPTLVAAMTQAAGGATPAPPSVPTATAETATEVPPVTVPTQAATEAPPVEPTQAATTEATAVVVETEPATVIVPVATDAGATVTAIPAATSTPGLTPELTVVIIGVTYEPTAEGGSTTPGASVTTPMPQATATLAPADQATAAPVATGAAVTTATPTPGGSGPVPPNPTGTIEGYPPVPPGPTGTIEGYPPATPDAGPPPIDYPAVPTVTPSDSGGGGIGDQATPTGGATETPVGGATPSQPGTPTPTSPSPTEVPTEAPTTTEEPAATEPASPTNVPLPPTAAVTPMASPTLAPTAATTSAATDEASPAATGTAAPLPTATPIPPTTLPQTGLSDWSFAVAGLVLILVIFGARRLRRA